jgi:hypothetical protein
MRAGYDSDARPCDGCVIALALDADEPEAFEERRLARRSAAAEWV